MKQYNDIDLNLLINACKEATLALSLLKPKKENHRVKELLAFRRSQLNLIRKRATELNLTEIDLNDIHGYVTNNKV